MGRSEEKIKELVKSGCLINLLKLNEENQGGKRENLSEERHERRRVMTEKQKSREV